MSELHQKHIVAFIDILGFREASTDEKLSKEILNALQRIRNDITNTNKTQAKPTISILSDAVIISIPQKLLNDNFRAKDAIITISTVVQKIANFVIQKGLLLRGAITFENFYHKDNILFGSAFIDAYELESKIAKYPRILASTKLLNFLNNDQFNEVQKYFLKDDEDGLYYLDYLPAALVDYIQNDIYKTAIQKTIPLLTEISKNNIHSSNILEKWYWFNNYHYKSISKKELYYSENAGSLLSKL